MQNTRRSARGARRSGRDRGHAWIAPGCVTVLLLSLAATAGGASMPTIRSAACIAPGSGDQRRPPGEPDAADADARSSSNDVNCELRGRLRIQMDGIESWIADCRC